MAFLGQQYDLADVPTARDLGPIPSGEYAAIITDSSLKPTKDGKGQYLELTHQIIDGPQKGRLVWARLNLVNANTQTVQIAKEQLSSIAHATGVLSANDSQAWHNRPMVVRVDFVKAGPKSQRDSNEIRAWKRIEGNPPPFSPAPPTAAAAMPPPCAQPAAAVAAAGGSAAPWKR